MLHPFLAFATTAFNTKGYYVYSGKLNNVLVYIGTTTQIPADRFRWHKANGKDLEFEVLHACKDEAEMLDREFELIKKLKPSMNKIKHRKQNLNVKLTPDVLAEKGKCRVVSIVSKTQSKSRLRPLLLLQGLAQLRGVHWCLLDFQLDDVVVLVD